MSDCPRMVGLPVRPEVSEFIAARFANRPDDGCCEHCGSLNPDTFMARLEAGDCILEPTDKDYKVYIKNDGGQPFKQTYGETYKKRRAATRGTTTKSFAGTAAIWSGPSSISTI